MSDRLASASNSNPSSTARVIWALVTYVWLALAAYAALLVAPTEKTMGLIYRIFYFHVPSFWTAFIAIAVTTFGSIAYLKSRAAKWDWIAVASAELATAFLTIGLITGPIWAKPVWGIWWTWDARLTSTFVLWLLYISYLILRGLLEDPEKKATLSAVFGIFASLDMPLVYVSNRLWRTQHPQPVILGGESSGLQATMAYTLVFCMIAICGVMILVLRDRYQLELMRNELAELRFAADRREAAGSVGNLGTARG